MLNIIVRLMNALQSRVARSDDGEVSIEYVLVGGLAAAAITAGMLVFGPAVTGWFSTIGGDVTSALP